MRSRKRTLPFSPWLYRQRNLVELSKLKHYRAVATRYGAANFLAAVKLAGARIWMRFMSR
jgi:transposase